ncbi:MAG TPA: amino acid ABC transporter permease [Anaerolineales bacterium]|nr:amino acid ABC transporter permease [Anaerolineales bacterium]
MSNQPSDTSNNSRQSRIAPSFERMAEWPWWLIVAILLGLFIVLQITTNQRMSVIFGAIAAGIGVTIRVTLAAYVLAVLIGLVVGFARVSSNKIIFNIASFYVEVVRGVPILVLLMYIAFVAVPLFAEMFGVRTRDFPNELRVILGLAIAYGAFESEIFRAGIQSIEKGQMEAARALGMNYFQGMRYIILPQAIRRVLPALGNDFVAMLKDSSLVSVLGVEDITQITKLYAASTFLFFQSYSILAFIYLSMTILLSRLVRALEVRLSAHR